MDDPQANKALIENNARIGANIAVELSKLKNNNHVVSLASYPTSSKILYIHSNGILVMQFLVPQIKKMFVRSFLDYFMLETNQKLYSSLVVLKFFWLLV